MATLTINCVYRDIDLTALGTVPGPAVSHPAQELSQEAVFVDITPGYIVPPVQVLVGKLQVNSGPVFTPPVQTGINYWG